MSIGKNTLPTHKKGSGNLIVNELTYDNIFEKIQDNMIDYDHLYDEAKKIYKKDFNMVKDNFINYLENNIRKEVMKDENIYNSRNRNKS